MLFYKIEGMLEGNTFSEDGAIRRQAAKEFQGKQELFAKKLQGKCYLSISQIRDGRITLAAVSREEYNILARCREFFQDTDVRVSNLAAQEVTYGVLRSLLSCAERYGFLEDDQDVYEMFHLSELFHNTYNFDETLLPGRVSLEEQKRQTAKLLCQDAFDQELERIYQGPALLVGKRPPCPLPAGVRRGGGQGTAGGAAPLRPVSERAHPQPAGHLEGLRLRRPGGQGPVGQPVPGLQRRGHGAELQPGGRRRRWPGLRRAGGSHGAVPGHPELSEPDPYRAVSLSRGGNREKTLLREPGPPDLCGAAGGRGGRGTGQGLLGKPGGERRSARRPGPVAGLEGGQGLPGRGTAPAF